MSLFSEFDPVSAKAWKQKIQFDLQGADYNDTLLFQTLEGITIKPFYTEEDLSKSSQEFTMPGNCLVSERITVSDAISGNRAINNALARGVQSVYLWIENETIAPIKLFENVVTEVSYYVRCNFLSNSYLNKLQSYAVQNNLILYNLNDSIGKLVQSGNWFVNQKKDFETLQRFSIDKGFQNALSIDTTNYQNAGANAVQQLAYALAHANEYVRHLHAVKDLKHLSNKEIIFEVAIGGHYLMEIAKVRALRLVWQRLAAKYDISNSCHIIATPSYRNKTVLASHTNSIRTGMECMAAMLGGANSVYNLPSDVLHKNANDFSTRIATNQLLVLQQETQLLKHTDPIKGSYMIESLTTQLVDKALTVFKTLQKGGGFITQLQKGSIQKKIKSSSEIEQNYLI